MENFVMRKQLTYSHNDQVYTLIDEPSQTVPDQTVSLRILLDRQSRGLPISGLLPSPAYLDDEDYSSDFSHMDLVEKQEFVEFQKLKTEAIREELQRQQAAKGRKTARAATDPDDAGGGKVADPADSSAGQADSSGE